MSSRGIDLTGKVYGELSVVKRGGKDRHGRWMWMCKCSCGEILEIRSNNLRTGNTKTCGGRVHEIGKQRIDLVGQRFGELAVVSWNEELSMKPVRGNVGTMWNCVCSCGEEVAYLRRELVHKKYKTCNVPGKHMTSNTAKRRHWAEQVKKEHDYTCQKCHRKKNKIHAHHILSFTKHPEYRYDVKNGGCLCEECHYRFHIIYGVLVPTKEDFYEYINNELEADAE